MKTQQNNTYSVIERAKKILFFGLLLGGMVACSSNPPTPQKLSQDVQQVSPTTVVSVKSNDSYAVPAAGQIEEKSGTYKTLDTVYDDDGIKVLIPKNAFVKGIYKNDGVSCSVTWSSVYANEDAYEDDQGSFSLSKVTSSSMCDPVRGVKSGDRLVIKFVTAKDE